MAVWRMSHWEERWPVRREVYWSDWGVRMAVIGPDGRGRAAGTWGCDADGWGAGVVPAGLGSDLICG